MDTRFIRRTAAFIALAGSALLGNASPLSYDMTVDWNSGPLSGTRSTGEVSWDSALAVPNGTYASLSAPEIYYTQVNLLSFSFGIGAKHYGLADVKVGTLAFDAAGLLSFFMAGTDCSPGSCGVTDDKPDAFYVAFIPPLPEPFTGTAGGRDFSRGPGSFTRAAPAGIPEPTAPALAGIALLALGAVQRSRRQR